MTERLRRALTTKFPLRMNENGTFRVLCVSDFHAPCGRRWDPRLKAALDALVDACHPDLVFIAGDLTHDDEGVGAEKLLHEYMADVMAHTEELGIAWAHIPGNHDREEGIPPHVFMAFPHCLSERGDGDLDGYGTYLLPVWPHDGNRENGPACCVWAFDTHIGLGHYGEKLGLTPDCDLNLPHMHTGFSHDDGVHFNQTAWYWDMSAEMEALYGRKIPGVMFLHRPPTEMYLVGKNPSMTGLTGEIREEIGASDINTGLFAAAYERGDIRAIISGHDHINSCAGTYLGILLAEDAGLGYDVYGDDDLRGGRVIEFSASNPDSVHSYHIYVQDCITGDKLRLVQEERV
ncbi:MAG: metallophosphoesterase [Clostridia bacterium]|nr:metallophosphoesterase [Clostridia bacterium]